ncbi:MAG: RodZ domain-containing protein [Cyanobacteria bacterium J06638_22]
MTKVMSDPTSPFEQQQLDQLVQIGTYLRQVREENLLTIEHVATKTMIQPRILRAIEEGKLENLPEPIYVRGFIKRYARELELDAEAVAQAFPVKRDANIQPKSWNDASSSRQLRPYHLYALYIAVIMAAIAGLSYLLTRGPIRTTATAPSPASIPSPDLPTPTEPAASPEAPPTPEPPAEPVQVEVTMQEQSWMRVIVDGETEFEGMLNEGTQRTWTADEEVQIRAGNAGGVLVEYNNQPAALMGDRGTVQQLVFTASGNSPLSDQATQ